MKNKVNKIEEAGPYFHEVNRLLQEVYNRGWANWVYNYVILTIKMWFFKEVIRDTNKWVAYFDSRVRYRMFLKGYVVNHGEPNQSW